MSGVDVFFGFCLGVWVACWVFTIREINRDTRLEETRGTG